MRKKTAEIVGFRGFNIESDAFMAILDLLKSNPTAMKKITNTAADMLLGGGVKKAVIVTEPLLVKFVMSNQRDVMDSVLADVPDLKLANWNDASLFRKLAKITAIGLVKDVVDTPFMYRRYIDDNIMKEFDKISEERGKQKLKMLLQRGGIASNRTAGADDLDQRQVIIGQLYTKLDRAIDDLLKDPSDMRANVLVSKYAISLEGEANRLFHYVKERRGGRFSSEKKAKELVRIARELMTDSKNC